MSTPAALLGLRHDFADRLPGLHEPWQAAPAPDPKLLLLNDALATELGLDAATLRSDRGIAEMLGADLPDDARPVAQAYSGHQFGGLSPRLGDGRALLLGEVSDAGGRLRDVHLKGSGRTPFSRGGDGKAAVGPVLREYVMGEAMHALGVPTTRALAAIATGEPVMRDTVLPGAVLVRVASSHLRVGTFQFAALSGDRDLLERLLAYAIERHHPSAASADVPALAFLDAVISVQAELVARWMSIGFIHGVMNTDNTTISGETIDYGPCAFMDRYDPATVFSSIDHGGRYAFGNQPRIIQWNLARLAETLLPLIGGGGGGVIGGDAEAAIDAATAALQRFPSRYLDAWLDLMRAKLAISTPADDDQQLITDLLDLMQAQHADYTSTFRSLASSLRGADGAVGELFDGSAASAEWLARWHQRVGGDPGLAADAMDAVNPLYIARNHLVEAALAAAVDHDDLEPMQRLIELLSDPYMQRPGLDAYAEPAPSDFGPYQTFCGT